VDPGAALEAGHLATIDSHIPAQGQALAAASVPVVLPAAQVTTLTPPAAITGFALEAGHLASIDTHTPALGQATMANSRPVVIASDQASIPAKSGHIELTGLSSTGTGTPLVASQDCLGYRSISLQLFGTFVGTVTFQQSNDNANWNNLPLIVVNSVGGSAPVNTGATTGGWVGPIAMRYVRFTVTAYTSGTIQGVVEIDAMPAPVQSLMALAAQSGTWSAAVGIAKVAGSSFSGQVTSPSLDANFGAATKNASKGSAGNVFAAIFTNANAAVRYAQLHNKATAPVATDVPIYSLPIPAGTANAPGMLRLNEEDFGHGGKQFVTGVGWAISTTVGTFTDAATAADHTVHVHYV